MAFSVNSPIGDGVTTQFAVSFTNGLYSRNNVHVFVGDETTERAFTWINDGLIDVQGTVPAVGEVVTIRRIMDKTNKAVDFADGEILDERNLDTMVDQLYNISHEFLDGYGLTEINTDVDMRGNSLTNVGGGDPTDPGSLATIGDLQSAIVSPEDLVDAVRISNNFSDLDDTAVCRTNLDVYSKAEVQEVTQANANILINGDFQVWQRGESFPSHSTGYHADRWATTSNRNIYKSDSNPPNTSFSQSLWVNNGTGSSLNLRQAVELPSDGDAGVFQLNETFTVSGYVKVDQVGRNINLAVSFTDDYNFAGRVDLISLPIYVGTGVWEKFEHTFDINGAPLPTNKCLTFQFSSDSDSVATDARFTGLKLERGSVATPFEVEPYGDVLLKCQRYCRRVSLNRYQNLGTCRGNGADTLVSTPQALSPKMRVAPTSTTINSTVRIQRYRNSAELDGASVTISCAMQDQDRLYYGVGGLSNPWQISDEPYYVSVDNVSTSPEYIYLDAEL